MLQSNILLDWMQKHIELSHFWITLDGNETILDTTIKQFNTSESPVYLRDIRENETTQKYKADLEAELTKAADRKLGFTRKADQKLEMVSQGNVSFPIAVKAHRIDFDNGVFHGLTLVSDNRDMF